MALGYLLWQPLFGAAHFAGGWSYVTIATAAGLGYAFVYHRTQSVEQGSLHP